MQWLTPFLATLRSWQLKHQFRDIERTVRGLSRRSRQRLGALTLREIGQASRSEFPHLYGTEPEARYLPWGRGTETGFERSHSTSEEVALRGIALWIAVAYHETKNADIASLKPQQRQLMALLRELKEAQQHGSQNTVSDWMQETATA